LRFFKWLVYQRHWRRRFCIDLNIIYIYIYAYVIFSCFNLIAYFNSSSFTLIFYSSFQIFHSFTQIFPFQSFHSSF
jgi:hypothetical protein